MKLVLREVRRFARSHVKELRVGPVVEPDAAHDDREPGAVWISRQGLRLNALGDLAGSAENETDPDQHVNWNPLHIENHEPELHLLLLLRENFKRAFDNVERISSKTRISILALASQLTIGAASSFSKRTGCVDYQLNRDTTKVWECPGSSLS